ncbi:MAG: sulfurtransferase [Thermomicrobia bacterium]|nr:sulfurtransferase [Thermomicrobia bacterium]
MQFVESTWLATHLADGSAIAVDTRPPQEYAQGHIAGAVSAYPYGAQAVSTLAGDAQFRAYVVEYMTRLGITGDETLVFYAMKNETTDARGLWTADFAGYERSALLAGGLQQWLAEGRPISQEPDSVRQPVAFTPHWNDRTFATADDAAAAMNNPAVVLLDVRSEGEHTGSAQGRYAGVNPRLGRIPGSVWIEWTELSNADGTYKSSDEIRQLLAAKGVTPDKEVITYCQGGGRAAHSYVALKSAGFNDVRHYVGSFGDYSRRADLPIETDE